MFPFLRRLSAFGLAMMLTGCSKPSPPVSSLQQTENGMTVTLSLSPMPHTGDNTFVVTLRNSATDAPIGNANITAVPEMLSPRLPGASVSGRAQGNGVYNIPVRLGIATRYSLLLHIQRPGWKQADDIAFSVQADQ